MGGRARIGAQWAEERCAFRVWAPSARRVEVCLSAPRAARVALAPGERGYHEGVVEGVLPGSLYRYSLDGGPERPDPASRFQPLGVHGPSAVVDPAHAWRDEAWRGRPLAEYVIYELHVGAFSDEGRFAGVIPHLAELADLGVTALELMPVAQCPGERNWGYDGVQLFAVQASYGGPQGLKELVEACHLQGLAVVLDVVYNHLGPEGNYLAEFGPYFTDRYRTPWGPALNFDGPASDEVRAFFVANALAWIEEFHIDALRLDAVHAIFDSSARPLLQELAETLHERGEALGRRVHVIAESSLNDPRLVRSPEQGGLGLDAQWNDDFHHSLHALLTGEREGYYQDFGRLEDLETALRDGYVYAGRYSRFRDRRHGSPCRDLPYGRFVVSAQNHDQVGNRMLGERLAALVDLERVKLAAAAVLLSPCIPLLFMGEEYGERAPFLYFVSHSDAELVEAVRRGRREEFAAFAWRGEPPDPQDEATFRRSRLDHSLKQREPHKRLLEFHRALLRLRRGHPALARLDREGAEVRRSEDAPVLWLRRFTPEAQTLLLLHLGESEANVTFPAGAWTRALDSAEERWGGPGSPLPERIEAVGATRVAVAPWSAALFLGAAAAEVP
jgi:maltooligosyltrehalose trehalohydrolase